MELAPERRNIWEVENGYVLLLEAEQLSPTAPHYRHLAPLQDLWRWDLGEAGLGPGGGARP